MALDMALEGEIEALAENHTPTVGDFDFVFENELLQEHKCPICLLAMRNPVQTKCGHRFCKGCFLKSFSDRREPRCPHDRQLIPNNGGWFSDKAWEREILSLRVKCKKSERGCNWTREIRHYQEHFEICQYEDVTCDKCVERVQRRLFDIHATSECPNRIIQCDYCEENVEFWQKEIHFTECRRFPFHCPQECGMQEIPQEEVDSHVRNDCIMTLVTCPYKEAGCSFYDKRNILKAHLEAYGEEHLSKTWSKLLRTTERLHQCETEITSMRESLDQVEEYEDEIKDLQVEKVAIKERLANSEKEIGDLQTNTESMTKRLSELEKAQPVVLESMKTLLDQKAADIISECRSSQKKCEEENIALKADVRTLKEELENTKSTSADTVQKLFRYVQVLHSEVQAMKGKQPQNPSSLATRPPQATRRPTHQPLPMPARAPVTRSLPDNTNKPHDPIKRRQTALDSGNAEVKKARIAEAAKCKTGCATSTANGQPKYTTPKKMSPPTEMRPNSESDSEEDSGDDPDEDSSEDECQARSAPTMIQ